MKISIITVAFNSAETLRDTIESVLKQTYTNIEYIIVDGLSKDSTVDIIKEYEPNFKNRLKWISEKDQGLYDAMNKGIRLATGDVIALINSDDLFAESTAIEKMVKCFKNHPEADAVYANLYYVSQNDTDKIVRNYICGNQRPFKYGWHPAHPTFYVKREIYQRYELFDLNLEFAADFELMLRFIEKYNIKLVYLKDSLVKMRLGGKTSKSFENIRKGNIECFRAFKKNGLSVSYLYPVFRLFPKLKQFLK